MAKGNKYSLSGCTFNLNLWYSFDIPVQGKLLPKLRMFLKQSICALVKLESVRMPKIGCLLNEKNAAVETNFVHFSLVIS